MQIHSNAHITTVVCRRESLNTQCNKTSKWATAVEDQFVKIKNKKSNKYQIKCSVGVYAVIPEFQTRYTKVATETMVKNEQLIYRE